MSNATFLSRGIDYLGDIGAKLRDLKGFRTLAHELIQNADDAPDATRMAFDVQEEALVIDNDGTFSDCGRIDDPECVWKEQRGRGHRCDFHRFRLIASGDKRGQAGTTGAFGIGFIAVYQVTDRPELISRGRHWILHEERAEHQRIEVCPGCERCRAPSLPGTRFFLPWAFSGNTPIRKALKAEPVPKEGPRRLLEDLDRCLSVAMLFLKRLRAVELRSGGRSLRQFERADDGHNVIISNGNPKDDLIWHILEADFASTAKRIRQEHPGRIEEKRGSTVRVAIPAGAANRGLLCACLPTEHDVGLPFHLNADFFPTNDRKHVILGDDFQSEWNRAALLCAATAVRDSLDRLPSLLGPTRFWELLGSLKRVHDDAQMGHSDPVLASFWNEVENLLGRTPIIFTTQCKWVEPSSACLLLQREEGAAVPVLEALGLNICHEDLRAHLNLLRDRSVGVAPVDIGKICDAMIANGLDRRVAQNTPGPLQDIRLRERLWCEIDLLLKRQQASSESKAEADRKKLRKVAIAPASDGALWPCDEIYVADSSTAKLIRRLELNVPLVAPEPAFTPLATLCLHFNVSALVARLEQAPANQLEEKWLQDSSLLVDLFSWLDERRSEITADTRLVGKLAELPIFPSGGKLHSLERTFLPGDFTDPLGLADLVDLAALGNRRELLHMLEMQELSFRTYAVSRLPTAFARREMPPVKLSEAVLLMAGRLGELKDDEEARRVLAAAPLVRCNDGQFRVASECYFDTKMVRECLESTDSIVLLLRKHEAALRDFYVWLGVEDQPRLPHLVSRIRELVAEPPSAATMPPITRILAHLGSRFAPDQEIPELRSMKALRWLPARGRRDRWFRPDELHAIYQDYLFESQGVFLDVPRPLQQGCQLFLQYLGVRIRPEPHLVVRHLLKCVSQGIASHQEVYRFLNDEADDPAIRDLRGERCLWIDGAYRAPHEVYWDEHPFGRFRWRLGRELRAYGKLLERLDVADGPTERDALRLLREIASKFGMKKEPLDDEARSVVIECWRQIELGLDRGAIADDEIEALGDLSCVPRRDDVLQKPTRIFFEDRAGLASKFRTGNIISRPVGAGLAMERAGVRPLRSAIDVELLECVSPAEDADLALRIQDRRDQIIRVLEGGNTGRDVRTAIQRLQQTHCTATHSMLVRYQLDTFSGQLPSEPEHVSALYDAKLTTLYYQRRDSGVPWASISRELAAALFPEEDPSSLAPGMKEVLASESGEEAAKILDELGYSRIDVAAWRRPSTEHAITKLGENGSVGAASSTTGREARPNSTERATEQTNTETLHPQDTPEPSEGQTGSESPVAAPTEAASTSKKERAVLRSYVISPAHDEQIDDDSNDDGARSPVDMAGIAHVLRYEECAGRRPKEMPHKNPGYDIESYDELGNIARFIEVKSLSGSWRDSWAVLSRRQFKTATELGEAFWLYVVERAQSGDFKVHCIPNPATSANHFMFDDGWIATSADGQRPEDGGHPSTLNSATS